MTLPSKSGGFQLPKIETVSRHICVESPDILYFDWDPTQYIQKVRHGEMKGRNGQNCLYLQQVTVFWPMGPNFWACLNILKVGILL